MKRAAFVYLLLIGTLACNGIDKSSDSAATQIEGAKGDSLALELATKVENAVGGQENWNKVHYLKFQFFSSRIWYWDKFKNRYRVESLKKGYRIAGTLDGKETKLWANGREETSPDSIAQYKQLAYEVWINDTYWLILPFKIKDPGVHLKYLGPRPIDSLHSATCLEMTFDQVGVTPDNLYHLYVDTTTNHIVYWEYYEHRTDTVPGLSNVWDHYQQYGPVTLSSGRGERGLKDIAVLDVLPDKLFEDITKPASEILSSSK